MYVWRPLTHKRAPQVVLVCGPAHIHGLLLRSIAPHLSPETYVGTIFAQGGFDWIATDALGDRMANVKALFGLQNIPWICKMTTYGSEARILGPKVRRDGRRETP